MPKGNFCLFLFQNTDKIAPSFLFDGKPVERKASAAECHARADNDRHDRAHAKSAVVLFGGRYILVTNVAFAVAVSVLAIAESFSAMYLPIPRAPPVMTAIFSLKSNIPFTFRISRLQLTRNRPTSYKIPFLNDISYYTTNFVLFQAHDT